MLSEEFLKDIKETVAQASPAPWSWGYTFGEKETDDPDINRLKIMTTPTGPRNIQLKADGHHRFWVELTDTQFAGDVVFDFDFIIEARKFVPELLAEIERLRGLLGKKVM